MKMLIDATKENDWPLNENSQKSDFKFAFGFIKNNEVLNATPWFLCRDFFNDFIAAQVALRNNYDLGFYRIYGYKVKEIPKYKKEDLLLLINMKDYPINVNNLQKSINDWEEKYESKSTITQVGNSLVVQYPQFWTNHHVLFSVYTFFVRMVINIELGIYTLNFKNLHYSDTEVLGYDLNSPIYLKYDFNSLIEDLKVTSWESPEYLGHIDNILKPDEDEDEDGYSKGTDETMYDLHNNGFVNYLQKNRDDYAI
jgi:hypothetical protein